jgi:hypothetical protein
MVRILGRFPLIWKNPFRADRCSVHFAQHFNSHVQMNLKALLIEPAPKDWTSIFNCTRAEVMLLVHSYHGNGRTRNWESWKFAIKSCGCRVYAFLKTRFVPKSAQHTLLTITSVRTRENAWKRDERYYAKPRGTASRIRFGTFHPPKTGFARRTRGGQSVRTEIYARSSVSVICHHRGKSASIWFKMRCRLRWRVTLPKFGPRKICMPLTVRTASSEDIQAAQYTGDAIQQPRSRNGTRKP